MKIPDASDRLMASALGVFLIVASTHFSPGLRGLPGAAPLHAGPLRTAPPYAGPLAGILAIPEPGRASILEGIFCTSRTGCWAVGEYSRTPGIGLNQVLHWNGSAWKRVAAPSPAGTASGDTSLLERVRCTSVRDCWAVGLIQRSTGAILGQALHWNGTKWSAVPTPQPGGTLSDDVNTLIDIACPSSASCWAAGAYGTRGSSPVILNQVLHWNGKKWALVRTPDPAGTTAGDTNGLDAIRCASAASCLAVGSYGTVGSPFSQRNEALKWNGSTWSRLDVPSPGGTGDGDFSQLFSLACSSSASCWAVGSYGTVTQARTSLNQVLHWNGLAWAQVSAPDPDGTTGGASQELVSVACSSATSCWAVGDYGTSNGGTAVILNQALKWDGGTWSRVDTPQPGGAAPGDMNRLTGASCTSSASCWAVGMAAMSGGSDVNQALRWIKTHWSPG